MRCGLGRCTGVKSTRFSTTPVVSFSHVHAVVVKTSMYYCWFTFWLLGTHPFNTIRWISKKTINMSLNFERLTTAFFGGVFGLGDDVDFHCIDCRLISGSYVNTQVSSQVIIEFDKSGSFSMRCKSSNHNFLLRSFYSSDSSFGTVFAQTFFLFNSSFRIRRKLSLSKLTSSATAPTPNLPSFK